MGYLKWSAVAVSFLLAAWMVFDGARAIAVGDYVTPSSGEYAGQLGPWSRVVQAIGVDPRSTVMKTFFVVYGLAWASVAVAFGLGSKWAWWAMLAMSLGALWYLWVGTLLSLLIVVLLMVPLFTGRGDG